MRILAVSFQSLTENGTHKNDLTVALREGVVCVARMLKCAEYIPEDEPEEEADDDPEKKTETREESAAKLKILRRAHRWTSRAVFRQLGLSGLEWGSGELTEKHKLAIAIFPAFWPGGIEDMFPLLFKDPKDAPGVGHVILKVLRKWMKRKPERFLKYVKEHAILKELRERGIDSRITNPYPFRLAVLLTYGQDKAPVPENEGEGPKEKRPVPIAGLAPEWEKHSEWVRDVLYPHLNPMRHDWAEVADKLKPRSAGYA